MRVRGVAVCLLASAFAVAPAGAQEPAERRVVRASPAAWEYGALEISATRDGTFYVFCRATPEGCVEELAEKIEFRQRSMNDGRRFQRITDEFARTVARLGRDGWEMVTETGRTDDCAGCAVLHFKRAVLVR
jgi:hypothetical protein